MSKHSQRGKDMGTCPDCLRKMYKTERTVVTPVRINGKWRGVLVHVACADAPE